MKRITPLFLGLFLLAMACNNPKTENAEAANNAAAVDTNKKMEAPPMDSAAMVQAWQNFMTPGPMHAMLAKSAGTWNADVKSWMAPGQEPMMSKATNVISMGMNGLYQMSSYTGSMMGMPFEGHGMIGYDNAKKVFVNSWADNMGSGIIYMTGTYDETTKVLSLSGMQTDPTTGKDAPIREELKFVDDNNHVLSMFGPDPKTGKEMMWMEATFKRKA